ncbi:hypothetical protein K2X85_15330 [bacterium]|nr:hypothetical protein [bacterium]
MSQLTSAMIARAVHLYLSSAYTEVDIPASKRHFASLTEADSLDLWLSQKGVEKPRDRSPAMSIMYAIRLGNAWYPHMKILLAVMDPTGEPLFSIDTHDRLEVPPGSPDEAGVKELQSKNRDLARAIEQAWEAAGIPTQAGLLKRYLASRKPATPE